ncbi:16635_t:CDS:2 [Funneliformis caledonium]|uniref:16635_t:CDS:1 n=1 Tax=Funneliformis caledonium TaxID=1117310 RepID=A0A9N9CMX5_9GLOM|nr:16635_t:CDS:2 [Funneliformis caledonium]
MSIISDAEKQQYFQVFSSLGPINGYLSDGQLDFDEFSVTYRLVNDLLAQIYPDVPLSLPPHLIPPSKAHLFGGGGTGFHGGSTLGISPRMIPQTISSIPQSISPIPLSINQIPQSNSPLLSNMMPSYSQSQQLPQVPPPPPSLYHQSSSSSYGGFPTAPLSDDFDWYMPPADKFNYENEYTKHVGAHGYVRFANFDELYQRLGIPREECIAAWNQVDVNFEQQLGKDQCLVYLHILNQRSKGKRIPDSLPSALKTSLVRGKLNYNYNETLDPSWKSKTSEGTSISTRSSYGQSHSGGKWEEEQLEKELAKLNENLKKAEDAALNSYTSALQISSGGGQTSEFKQLYEYKQKQLAELNEKEHLNRTLEEYIRKERLSVRELQDNIQSLKLHVKTLENTLETNQSEYRRLQQDVNLGR